MTSKSLSREPSTRSRISRLSTVQYMMREKSKARVSVRAGILTHRLFRDMNCRESVTEWLHAIGMELYIPIFEQHAITGEILLSLTSIELQKSLGVKRLKDRRILLEGIEYLQQTLSLETKATLPEDGRILTHLSNERIVLQWIRFSIILQTVGVATIRLENLGGETENIEVDTICYIISAVSIATLLYCARRYYWMKLMIEQPGEDHLTDSEKILTPSLLGIVIVVTVLYAIMSQSIEEATSLVLIAV